VRSIWQSPPRLVIVKRHVQVDLKNGRPIEAPVRECCGVARFAMATPVNPEIMPPLDRNRVSMVGLTLLIGHFAEALERVVPVCLVNLFLRLIGRVRVRRPIGLPVIRALAGAPPNKPLLLTPKK